MKGAAWDWRSLCCSTNLIAEDSGGGGGELNITSWGGVGLRYYRSSSIKNSTVDQKLS
jgi:hypothetical protein